MTHGRCEFYNLETLKKIEIVHIFVDLESFMAWKVYWKLFCRTKNVFGIRALRYIGANGALLQSANVFFSDHWRQPWRQDWRMDWRQPWRQERQWRSVTERQCFFRSLVPVLTNGHLFSSPVPFFVTPLLWHLWGSYSPKSLQACYWDDY